MDGRGQYPDADGQFNNAPIFNFNDGEVKFNTNWASNANDNYGSASGFLPKSLPNETMPPIFFGGIALYLLFTDLIQPPSIRPISSIADSSVRYFLPSIAFVSFISRMNTRKRFNRILAVSRAGSFSDFCSLLAAKMFWRTSKISESHRSQIV